MLLIVCFLESNENRRDQFSHQVIVFRFIQFHEGIDEFRPQRLLKALAEDYPMRRNGSLRFYNPGILLYLPEEFLGDIACYHSYISLSSLQGIPCRTVSSGRSNRAKEFPGVCFFTLRRF